jgi:hypothetical protein
MKAAISTPLADNGFRERFSLDADRLKVSAFGWVEGSWKTGHQAGCQSLLLEFILGERLLGGWLQFALIEQTQRRIDHFAFSGEPTALDVETDNPFRVVRNRYIHCETS